MLFWVPFCSYFQAFAKIFKDFVKVFWDFSQISMDFSQIFTKLKLFIRTPTSYTSGAAQNLSAVINVKNRTKCDLFFWISSRKSFFFSLFFLDCWTSLCPKHWCTHYGPINTSCGLSLLWKYTHILSTVPKWIHLLRNNMNNWLNSLQCLGLVEKKMQQLSETQGKSKNWMQLL